MSQDIADTLRGISFTLYVFLIGQTGYILKHYFQVIRLEKKMNVPRIGLLPTHVVLLGVSLIGFATEAVYQNLIRFGNEITGYAIVNPILMAVTVFGLYLVMNFEYGRYKDIHASAFDPHDKT